MTRLILDRCRVIAPELLDQDGEFEVVGMQVGLRPSRVGGPRMEVEWLGGVGGEGGAEERFVCHCYGHHSAGWVRILVWRLEADFLCIGLRGLWVLRMTRLIWSCGALKMMRGSESMRSRVRSFMSMYYVVSVLSRAVRKACICFVVYE